MKTSGRKSPISWNPALVTSVLTAVISFVLPFLFVGIIALVGTIVGISNKALGDFLAYLFTSIAVAIMCFLICKAHPGTVWFTPVICYASKLLAGIGNFFKGNPDVTLPFAIGWILSIIAAFWGTDNSE